MPLTSKGETIKSALEKEYGSEKKAEQVLYAGKNKGTFTGIDEQPPSNILGGPKNFGMPSDQAPPSRISNLADARDQPAYKQAGPENLTLESIQKKNREYWAPDWAKRGER